MTSRHQTGHEHGTSPSDRRCYRKSKPRNRSLPLDLLRKPPRNVEITPTDPRVLIQHETTCHSEGSSTLPPNGIQPHFHSHRLPDHEHPSHTRTTTHPSRSKKGSKRSPRISKTENDGKNNPRIYTIQERRQGLARIETPQTSTRKQETRPETRRTLPNHRSPQPPQLPSIFTENLAHSSRLPRFASNPLQTQRHPWRKLPS